MANSLDESDKSEIVCVTGSGYLGTQIGVLCAKHGYKVNMYDISKRALNTSLYEMKAYLNTWFEEGQITGDTVQNIIKRVCFTENLEEAASKADFVIEAVIEDIDVKRELLGSVSQICPPETPIATNSSSIRVSRIEGLSLNPERILNMHFYSYPWRSRVLELMKGNHTTDEIIKKAVEFSMSLNITPLIARKESTGFIFNRVWRAVKRECLKVVDEGVASFEDVDRAWMSIYGMSVGPFGLMDRVGLDVVRDIENIYYCESGDPTDKPPSLLIDKINRGELGVKTGKGFYTYPKPVYLETNWLHPQSLK
jgi:3-hydroxybutyryl-CoA dehydrogenase